MKRFPVTLAIIALICSCLFSCTESEKVLKADELLLSGNWAIQSSAEVSQDGAVLSTPSASTNGWYKGTVPNTVMGILTANGLYEDLLFGMNYGKADRTPFDVPWWYRTTFKAPSIEAGQHVTLEFDGLTYRANIWLNGKRVGSKEEVYGAFRRFHFDVTDLLEENNVLAVEVFRAREAEANMGFVDWNPRPLDENMGIYREVRLLVTGDVEMNNTWVKTLVNTETLDEAWLTIETKVTNRSDKKVKGKLRGTIENIEFTVPVTLAPKEISHIKITPDDVKELHIKNPRLWWCRGLGNPELYDMKLEFITGNNISDVEDVTFGIRKIETYITGQDHKGFKLNGKKVLVKSAGWTDDIFLRDTPESNEIQVQYVSDMNMNSIRFEGVWGTSRNIYELCDKYGLMAMVGWSCQWEWENYFGAPADPKFGCIQTEHDMDLLVTYMDNMVCWLRNHPSIICWLGGSDMLLNPELERRYMDLLPHIDDRPFIGSAARVTSEVTGPSGMKMAGPYDYVGPNYWFTDTRNGGNYGFNTETGVGAQVTAYESLLKMIPEDKLWPLNEYWDYHTTTAETMNSMKVATDVIAGMYGKPTDLKSFLNRSYLMASQSTKSMFEAFRVNPEHATGIVQWMLNSAWPSVYWQLYDYFMIPTASYYSVKKGNLPKQLIYNYKDNGIYAINETLEPVTGLTAVVRGHDIQGKLLFEEMIPLNMDASSVKNIFTIDNSAKNTFLSLAIIDGSNQQIADNSYCLSSQEDIYGRGNWFMTPITTYGDFKDLTRLPATELNVHISKLTGAKQGLRVEIENPSNTIALQAQFALTDQTKDLVYPTFWSDNYITLMPGEKKTLECEYDNERLNSPATSLKVTGWNIKNYYLDLK